MNETKKRGISLGSLNEYFLISSFHRYNFLLEKQEGHKLRIDLFDEDSFSRDDYLGKVVIEIEDYLGNPAAECDEGLPIALQDDALENSSTKPTEISGEVSFHSRYVLLYIL